MTFLRKATNPILGVQSSLRSTLTFRMFLLFNISFHFVPAQGGLRPPRTPLPTITEVRKLKIYSSEYNPNTEYSKNEAILTFSLFFSNDFHPSSKSPIFFPPNTLSPSKKNSTIPRLLLLLQCLLPLARSLFSTIYSLSQQITLT